MSQLSSSPLSGIATAIPSDYEIEVDTSLVDRSLRNLKDGDAFAVLDSRGDIGTSANTVEGLFYRDTRFLSHMELRLQGKKLLLLNSTTHDDKAALTVELANPDLELDADQLPRENIFVERTKFLWKSVCYERLSIKNFGPVARRLTFEYLFKADFRDLFEVRGMTRAKRGQILPGSLENHRVEFHYRGLDKLDRRTFLAFSPPPHSLAKDKSTHHVTLEPGAQTSIFVSAAFEEGETTEVTSFFHAYRESRRARRRRTYNIATVQSSSELFNEVACRSTSDVYTLISPTNEGIYPYAGIPWFSTVFGRDGILTAMSMLWIDPKIARGVLRTLAAYQATGLDPKSDASPGKILHELRHGEMANLGEVPFRRYYGSVDSTPLFIMLAGMYLRTTGDAETISEIWPNIKAALAWIDNYGDLDGDGFVEYQPESSGSLTNQGWKDSHDSVFHADGTDAAGPLALCEVQGYVFAAKRFAAGMAEQLGFADQAAHLSADADILRARFETAFWDEQMGTYVLALDGEKRACRVRTSNAGHALFTGIASPERARRVADGLMNRNGFSGWGIRTLAQGEPRYNPMSYHNGSVWPHDNAVIATGFARYGFKADAARVFEGLFDAAKHQELRRLPELFCGFMRRPRRGPTPYPVACSPQAWSASAMFGILGACLGIEQDYSANELRVREPSLPASLNELMLHNFRLGASRADLRMHRYGTEVATTVLSREGDARIVVVK